MSITLTRTLRISAGPAAPASDLHVEKEGKGIFAFTPSALHGWRRDTPRRIKPDLIEFHRKRAHALRAEYFRNMGRAVWALLMKIVRR
jgi:hypothetical protein